MAKRKIFAAQHQPISAEEFSQQFVKLIGRALASVSEDEQDRRILAAEMTAVGLREQLVGLIATPPENPVKK